MIIWTSVKNITILILCIFFLIVGVNTLIGSYSLNNPVEFVMYFFSSSLLILVCIAGLIYLFFRVFPRKQSDEINNHEEN
ncbi:MAG: hypothetical protein A4E71_03194 [Smithella sp. PtaU1.Bin162]|nr:MAG: hypothetical protein A4E71_03194 [Smithella sp. PtaU1.Bin162]